ncbi:hypothetical protein [Desulforamulus ruminis]|uniref:Uncharacterized protein n=1 Tax=Desulforamulus ruminis (strain ATCC 23193 / DSM 2154 / NCIMB 8452 / DL) TaxID=696281 RepID=F6DS72_DESRL|nr:hypothetical protein [Desulforamulus ruminis]AEG58834.1 hypothetical protein Desru_0548 [Desulforamulus ruminis DSM 2154]
MPIRFGPIERVFVSEQAALTPGSILLPNGGSVDLASITVQGDCPAVLLQAVINFSVTFTPLITPVIATVPGFAQITFEFLLNGTPIYRVTETAEQAGLPLGLLFTTASTTFETVNMLHFDLSNLTGLSSTSIDTYTLRASNIILTPPLVTPAGVAAGTVSAAAGPVTFIAEAVRIRRDEDEI